MNDHVVITVSLMFLLAWATAYSILCSVPNKWISRRSERLIASLFRSGIQALKTAMCNNENQTVWLHHSGKFKTTSLTLDLNSSVFSILISSSVRLIFLTPSLHSFTIWGRHKYPPSVQDITWYCFNLFSSYIWFKWCGGKAACCLRWCPKKRKKRQNKDGWCGL